MRSALLAAALAWLATPASVPISSFAPPQPRWGQALEVRYDPASSGAALTEADAVHVVAWIYDDVASDTVWMPMRLVDGAFETRLPLPEGTAYVRLNFVTRSDWDPNAGLETMVHDDTGEPARGAYRYSMTPQNLEEHFRAELQRDPGQYAAYRDYWFTSRIAGRDIDERLRADLQRLEGLEGARPASLLYALCCGRSMVGDEPAGRRWLLELMDRFPDSPFTQQARSCYQYEVFARQIELADPQRIPNRVRALAAGHPSAPVVREDAWHLAHDAATPLETMEQVHAAWVAEQPDHPMAWFALAVALERHDADPQRGARLAARAADLILDGRYRFYEDVSGKLTSSLLPAVYTTAARHHLRAKQYGSALAAVRAAEQLAERPAEAHRLEAELWQALGDLERAASSLAQAWRHDPVETEPWLRRLWESRHEEGAEFADWLAARVRPGRADDEGLDPAPDVEVAVLDGRPVQLSALRGKVVVLNFWFVACAPCVVEMPALNRLVRRFADEPVVFLAPALDTEKIVRRFLREREFHYRVAPDAGSVHGAFDVASYPTHILIDKRGVIRHRLSGGGPDADRELGPLIELLLR